MEKKILLLVLCIVMSPFYVSAQTTKTLILPRPIPPPAPGNIELLDGYTHIPKRGIDAAVGEITKPNGMTINYLIGNTAELATGRVCGRKNSNCLWYKIQKVNGREVWLALTKEGQLIATFPKERANFYANTKSSEDIADFLIMILTYETKVESQVKNKTKIYKSKQK